MRTQDNGRAMVQQILNRRQSGANTGVIPHRTVLDRHVEIHPHQHLFVFYIYIFDGLFIEHAFLLLLKQSEMRNPVFTRQLRISRT